jgi:transposase
MNPAQQARQRASLILQVQAGQLSATQAAQSLGVSRKTYYQWERRALQGMVDQLTQRPPGRPQKPDDPEKQLRQAQAKLQAASQLAELRAVLRDLDRPAAKKKPRPSKR